MKSNDILDAIGKVDDKYIKKAKEKKKSYKVMWGSMTALAACLCIIVISVFTAGNFNLLPFGSKTEEKVVHALNLMEGISAQDIESVDDLTAFRAAISDFAVRLFQASKEDGENTLISPLSVLFALSMTVNGAEGETLAQMEEVLGMKTEELNHYLYTYRNTLPQDEKYRLNLANSIWFIDHESFKVNQDFLQVNADYYGADIYKAPFDNSTLKDINNWVKDKTDNMIPEILDKISEDAVMYLVNALTFEAEWADIYEKDQVRDGIFTLEDGTAQVVEFMYGEEGNYLEDNNAKGFIKYYEGGKYAFAAMLPNEDTTVSEYIAALNGIKLNELLSNPQSAAVRTAIPKFEMEYSTEMSEILSAMGMNNAFDSEKADFTGLGTSTVGNIYISRVLHKTMISVGEQGTKAGAATVIEMVAESAEEGVINPKIVYLDRPFVYMLIDCETNIPFFIGTMMNVAENN